MKNKPTIDPSGRATFVFSGYAQKVSLCGDFNEWRKIPMVERKGRWYLTTRPIPTGTYAFSYVIDGVQQALTTFDVGQGDYPLEVWPDEAITPRKKRKSELTIVTLNTHSLQTNTRRFAKLNEIAKGLAYIDGDIICLNEVVSGKLYARGYDGLQVDTAEYIRRGLSHYSGKEHYLVSEPFARWEQGEQLGNAVVSPYPITDVSSTAITTKSFWPAPDSQRRCLACRISLPKRGNVSVFVTHLMGYDYPETPVQIKELKEFVAAYRTPDDYASIVAGDFNIPATAEENYKGLIKTSPPFIDTYASANPQAEGITTPDSNNRIDYIFWVNGRANIGNMQLSSTTAFNGEPFQNRVMKIVSDHYAVITSLS